MSIKKWYYLKCNLDLSSLKEGQLEKAPEKDAIEAFQKEVKDWESNGKKGEQPKPPKGKVMNNKEVVSTVLQSVLNAKYKKTNLDTLKKIRNIRTILNKDVQDENTQDLKIGDKDYKLMLHAWDTFEEWPASVLNQELLPQIDEILREAKPEETLKSV